jgi:MFS family permease
MDVRAEAGAGLLDSEVRVTDADGGTRSRRWSASLQTLRFVIAEPRLRRVLIAFGLFRTTELATWVALLVWAYDRGGTRAAGIIAVAQLVPATLAAPLGSVLTDRMARERGLRLGYLVQAATGLLTAGFIFADAPFWAVAAAAAAATSSMTLTRPVHHALIPELSRSPEELTAGNAASTALEGVGNFLGPALAGGLLVVAGAPWVFVTMAVTSLVSAQLTRGLAVVQSLTGIQPSTTYWADAAEGFRVVVRQPSAAALTAIVTGQFVVVGILDILAVVFAFDVLSTGPSGPGLITSGLGIGGLIGAAAAVTMIGRRRLGPALAVGMAIIAASLALVAVSLNLAVAVTLFALAGIGKATVDVAARTLLQRSVPPRVLARILGVQEALLMAGTAVGAALAPVLIRTAGSRGAFVATATLLPAVGLASWVQVRRLDRAAPPSRLLDLLASVRMFAVLPPTQLEQLATALQPVTPLRDGEVLIRQGDVGDRCYVVVDGALAVDRDGEQLAVLGASEVVGEIALLRDVPRTATVRAKGPVEVMALERRPFLLAVTGSELGYQVVDHQVRQRLGEDGASADIPEAG